MGVEDQDWGAAIQDDDAAVEEPESKEMGVARKRPASDMDEGTPGSSKDGMADPDKKIEEEHSTCQNHHSYHDM